MPLVYALGVAAQCPGLGQPQAKLSAHRVALPAFREQEIEEVGRVLQTISRGSMV